MAWQQNGTDLPSESQERSERNNVPEECVLVAHDTSDGWALGVEDRRGEIVAYLRWPWEKERVVSSGELKRMGFRIV